MAHYTPINTRTTRSTRARWGEHGGKSTFVTFGFVAYALREFSMTKHTDAVTINCTTICRVLIAGRHLPFIRERWSGDAFRPSRCAIAMCQCISLVHGPDGYSVTEFTSLALLFSHKSDQTVLLTIRCQCTPPQPQSRARARKRKNNSDRQTNAVYSVDVRVLCVRDECVCVFVCFRV